MPEIGEVARIVHYLKKHIVGKTIASVTANADEIVYGKVGTSSGAFEEAMTGKKVVDARQQGKYFWLQMSSPPHPLMHFGMSGWMKFSNDDTSYYKPTKAEESAWPPKYCKFVFKMKEDPDCEVAFVDPRRLGRIRLVDAEGDQMRYTTPLKENGPDPVVDSEILTQEWLAKKLRSKKVPVKALLLDQANISGVGNWVADEVLYQARLHPEQYSNTFSDAQIKQLHDALIDVCSTAVNTLADSTKFPENWIMRHRWGKGKENGGRLPNGDKIVFLKVGGRTSAVVPSVQKKTGAVAGDVDMNGLDEQDDDDEDKKPKKGSKGQKKSTKEEEKADERASPPAAKRGRKKAEQKEPDTDAETEEAHPATKKQKTSTNGDSGKGTPRKNQKKGKAASETPVKNEDIGGRRRSGRVSKA